MLDRILIAVDFSSRTRRALRAAAELTGGRSADVTLLHVVERVAHIPDGELRDFYQDLVTLAERRLTRIARSFARARLRVEVTVMVGNAPRAIALVAARTRASLLVMGSHRVEGRRGRGWGTTSYRAALLCRCPVLLVK